MSIFIGSIPNSQKDDILLARRILQNNIDTKDGEKKLRGALANILKSQNQRGGNTEEGSKDYSTHDIFLFNRGRDSLYFFLSLLDLQKDDEIITQAFTCVAVVAPILWANAKPVYVDINTQSFNIDINLLRAKISDKTRAIILQHTFGNLVDVKRVREMVDKINMKREENRKIYIIEDCAHVFPSNLSDLKIGNDSDVYFFSFSQDKTITSTQGALMRILDKSLLKIAREKYIHIPKPNRKEALYNARYIKLWSIIKNYYFTKLIPFTNITLGRALIIIFRFLGLIKKQASTETLNFDLSMIKKMSQVQMLLLINQLSKLKYINKHRESIVDIYKKNLKKEFRFNSNHNLLLRYPLLLSNRQEVKERILKEKIIIGNWYSTPVHPLKTQLDRVGYKNGSCINAERTGEHVMNLPTSIETKESDAIKIAKIINDFAKPINI